MNESEDRDEEARVLREWSAKDNKGCLEWFVAGVFLIVLILIRGG